MIVWLAIFLHQNAYTDGVWEEKTEELSFADFRFLLTHTWLKSNCEDSEKSAEKESAEDDGDNDDDEGNVWGRGEIIKHAEKCFSFICIRA